MSERKACDAVEIPRQSYRYQCQAKEGGEIQEALQNLAQQHPRWGFKKMNAVQNEKMDGITNASTGSIAK
ncbi:MAG: hypothetical protein WA110_01215 [Anaerolineaceae bacterium]